MNGFGRYKAILDGYEPDFLPRVPILMQFAAEYIGSDYGKFAADYRVLVDSNIKCAEDFSFDQVSCISDPYRETQGFGSEITYIKDGPPRSTHPLKDTKDLSILSKPDPLKSERMLDRVKAAEEYSKRTPKEYSILGWVEGPAAEAADLRDVINFLMDTMDDETFSCKLMDICTETAVEFARAQVEAGCDTIGIGDAIASQMTPDVYVNLIQPREKKIVDAIHEMGAYVKLHICGDITMLLPGIADLDVDIVDVDHMVDLTEVRNTLGSDVVIAGNLDPAGAVQKGNPESIYNGLLEIYEETGNPFMPMAGCEIPAATPHENLKALCKPIPFTG